MTFMSGKGKQCLLLKTKLVLHGKCTVGHFVSQVAVISVTVLCSICHPVGQVCGIRCTILLLVVIRVVISHIWNVIMGALYKFFASFFIVTYSLTFCFSRRCSICSRHCCNPEHLWRTAEFFFWHFEYKNAVVPIAWWAIAVMMTITWATGIFPSILSPRS